MVAVFLRSDHLHNLIRLPRLLAVVHTEIPSMPV